MSSSIACRELDKARTGEPPTRPSPRPSRSSRRCSRA